MKFPIDMNLSPLWVSFLAEKGFTAVHWSTVGQPWAADSEIFDFAAANEWIVFTHDWISVCYWLRSGQEGPVSFKSARRTFYRPRLATSCSGQSRPLNQTSKLALSLPSSPSVIAFGCYRSE